MLQNCFIKIGRLATGIAVSILISLWMHDELTHSDQNYNHGAQITQHDWFSGRKEPGGQASKKLLNTKLCNAPKDNLVHTVLSSQKVEYTTANADMKLLESRRIMETNIRTYFTRELLTHDSLRKGNALSSMLFSKQTAIFFLLNPHNFEKKVKIITPQRFFLVLIIQNQSHYSFSISLLSAVFY